MKFPQTNHIRKKPIPENVESNVKKLEEQMKKIDWRIFGKAYIYILGYVLITVFALIVVVGVAKTLVNLIS